MTENNQIIIREKAQEKNPENRKDIYIEWEKVLMDAVRTNNINGQIYAIQNSIITALPELKNHLEPLEYGLLINELDNAEPTYNSIKKELENNLNLIVPEMINSCIFIIKNNQKHEHLKNLYKIRYKVTRLLTEKVNWYFNKENTPMQL